MAFRDIQEFIALLEKRGRLKRIKAPVSADLEITEIADRMIKADGPALLFENVRGSNMPLAINLLGTRERMSWALGVDDLDEIGDRIANLIDLSVPEGLWGKLSLLPKLKEVAGVPPRTVKTALCQEIILTGDKIDLTKLPVLTCWPKDGGPFITLPLVVTKDFETGKRNLGMYRMQIYDKNSTGMHWQRHKTGARHFEVAKRLGKKMPVAVALGCDPAVLYSATAPLPDMIEEYMFAGFLRKQPVDLVKAATVDLEVPANAEIVLEGYVDPAEELKVEGPFGDHTGFYTTADLYPTFHVTAITMRRNPIYVATIVGRPPMEDYWMGHATERIFRALTRMIVPDVVDYHMPAEGIFHNLVFVSIKKRYPGHAHAVMNALWGMGLMMLAKVIVVVDEDVNVQDTQEAWWITLNNIDPQRDVRFTPGPVDVLDHASQYFSYGTKMGIDATRKWPEEGFTREWPEKIEMDATTKALVDRRWSEYGLDKVESRKSKV